MGNDNGQITKEQRNKQQNNISENIILNKEGSYDVQIYIKEVKPVNTQRKISIYDQQNGQPDMDFARKKKIDLCVTQNERQLFVRCAPNN